MQSRILRYHVQDIVRPVQPCALWAEDGSRSFGQEGIRHGLHRLVYQAGKRNAYLYCGRKTLTRSGRTRIERLPHSEELPTKVPASLVQEPQSTENLPHGSDMHRSRQVSVTHSKEQR